MGNDIRKCNVRGLLERLWMMFALLHDIILEGLQSLIWKLSSRTSIQMGLVGSKLSKSDPDARQDQPKTR